MVSLVSCVQLLILGYKSLLIVIIEFKQLIIQPSNQPFFIIISHNFSYPYNFLTKYSLVVTACKHYKNDTMGSRIYTDCSMVNRVRKHQMEIKNRKVNKDANK